MTISPLALAAKKVIDAAWLHGDAYDLSSQAAFALESAQLLQSPETAAEVTELRRQLESARVHGQRLIRAEQRTAELEAVLGTHRKDDQAEIERLRARLAIAEGLLAERDRPVDEAPIAYELTPKAKAAADKLTHLLAPVQALRENESAEEQALRRSVDAQFPKVAEFLAEEKITPAQGPAITPEPTGSEPARGLPQIAVGCPACHARPGDLCTSHSGTRPRRDNTHQARRAAWVNTQKGGTA